METARCGLLDCEIPVLRPSTTYEMQLLRNRGLREAGLYQITKENRGRLCYIGYPSGSLRINIWST